MGSNEYLTQTSNTYIQAVSIHQHITKKPSKIMYLNLRKASVIRVMAILPNSRPSTGWRRGDLTNNCIKEISMSAKLRYSRTATIKLWRQHLGAQLPGTLPQNPWQEAPRQCSCHKTIGTIPRYTRDPKFFLVKFEKRRVKTLRQDASPERRRDWGVKRSPNSLIYIIPKWLKPFLDSNNANDSIKQGAPKSGKALITNL